MVILALLRPIFKKEIVFVSWAPVHLLWCFEKNDSHYIHVGPYFVVGLIEREAAGLLKDNKAYIQKFEIRYSPL
jgi:hypothetical protein